MERILVIAACAFALPGAALAATRTYDTGAFDKVAVASGIEADITTGPARSVRAETTAENLDDLRISVKDNVLRIERSSGSWFSGWFERRPDYKVHVVTPVLRGVDASSGTEVTVRGSMEGDFSVTASSGSEVEVSLVKGGNVKAHSSSGSDLSIAGSCISLEAEASSGSDLDADDLKCENVAVQASSGSDVSVAATKSVKGRASSGSDVRVKGKPPTVQVETSSGANVVVRE
jgi:hypothetical protein